MLRKLGFQASSRCERSPGEAAAGGGARAAFAERSIRAALRLLPLAGIAAVPPTYFLKEKTFRKKKIVLYQKMMSLIAILGLF